MAIKSLLLNTHLIFLPQHAISHTMTTQIIKGQQPSVVLIPNPVYYLCRLTRITLYVPSDLSDLFEWLKRLKGKVTI